MMKRFVMVPFVAFLVLGLNPATAQEDNPFLMKF